MDPSEVTRKHAAKQGFTFTFLSDEKTELIRRYDLLHPGGGLKGDNIAFSAELLVDSTGTVRWSNLTQGNKHRATAPKILKLLDQLDPMPRLATQSAKRR